MSNDFKGSPGTVDVRFGKWEVSARNRRGEKVELSAFAPREKFLLLKFMTPQDWEFNDFEKLFSKGNKLR